MSYDCVCLLVNGLANRHVLQDTSDPISIAEHQYSLVTEVVGTKTRNNDAKAF
ncbi:hypothetical protein PISMIDRAFT_682848 [Pisolithus microcarpus 441]|uniref:Uncharacterized protein n=1 Tax=Pisolithus microcarpus 441 TaxID=765257 RepID=A0A0C9Y4P7_9AGAM|nr:hypothetical protein PISMIDRAFT_682848 [Pisolithus microcarpus 441]